jgi:hypothetical protein
MRRLLGCGMVIVMLIAALFFVRGWNAVTTWGTGTGNINREIQERAPTVRRGAESALRQISQNPIKFKGQKKTVRGRVRAATKIASNRNLYLLVEGDSRVLVIDDKAPPRVYYPRQVTGVVQTVAGFGGKEYAYVTDVKSGVKVNPLKWQDIAKFFTEKYDDVQAGVREELAS